ncbi:sigma-70 family RNA polymerase sigma factor [bacterium]|nr:sigma-70 family RNA polymerase sigma factor [bacterium]
MPTHEKLNLKLILAEHKDLIETIAKTEYQRLGSNLTEYLELVNIGVQTIYNLYKADDEAQYNNTYLSTAIKWAIRNEIRRKYKWYSCRNTGMQQDEFQEDLRASVYKTILSIDEMADSQDNPKQIKDNSQTPDEIYEFHELKTKIEACIKKLPPREKMFIEQKFFEDKKLRDLAAEHNLSLSRVSRIIQSGLNKIKKELNK